MGTIKTTNIQSISGSGTVTLGTSGETFTVPSGVTVNMSSATQTGVGGTMTPAFQGRSSTSVSTANNTWTKMTVDTEDFDTDGKFDHSSNYRFTPTVAGKYYCYGKVYVPFNSPDSDYVASSIYKNGSSVSGMSSSVVHRNVQIAVTVGIIDLDADDYIELYGRHQFGDTRNLQGMLFGGYKLIGV